jgi:hypothetical protein
MEFGPGCCHIETLLQASFDETYAVLFGPFKRRVDFAQRSPGDPIGGTVGLLLRLEMWSPLMSRASPSLEAA